MYFYFRALTFSFALLSAVHALPTAVEEDLCPKTEYACFDVINSSLCLSQQATPGAGGTGETMAKCVEFDGAASNLSGGAKLCRCTGCHEAFINEAIKSFFPAPCTAY